MMTLGVLVAAVVLVAAAVMIPTTATPVLLLLTMFSCRLARHFCVVALPYFAVLD